MKMEIPRIWWVSLAVLFSGCAGHKQWVERGWIGGTYSAVHDKFSFRSDVSKSLLGLPPTLRGRYQHGLLVTRVFPGTPAEKAGLKEGDLILRVSQAPVSTVQNFLKTVDQTTPGTVVTLTIYRGGGEEEVSVKMGRERFKDEHFISVAVGVSSVLKLDLMPNPDFSLLAIGLEHQSGRLEFSQPEARYLRSLNPAAETDRANEGALSEEGWEAWLAIFHIGGHKRIKVQEMVE